jgi:ATP-dependent Clp protease ATP-binding subunit ClpC
MGFVSKADEGNGFGSEKALRDRVLGRLRETMRPEFLNRIDEIVLFRKLDHAQLRRIVRLMLNQTEARLQSQGITLEVSETAVDWIAERGYEPEYGARPMRRVIQRELDDRIADLFVASDLQSGGRVAVSVEGQSLVVEARHEAMPLAA